VATLCKWFGHWWKYTGMKWVPSFEAKIVTHTYEYFRCRWCGKYKEECSFDYEEYKKELAQ